MSSTFRKIKFVDVANGWPKRRMKKVYEGHRPITRSVTKILKNKKLIYEYIVVSNPTFEDFPSHSLLVENPNSEQVLATDAHDPPSFI